MNWLPKHEAGLYITHNEHKDSYETVADYVAGNHPAYDPDDFVSEEDMQKCIDTNECWTLQWYPHTPVGFHKICASSLEVIAQALKEKNA